MTDTTDRRAQMTSGERAFYMYLRRCFQPTFPLRYYKWMRDAGIYKDDHVGRRRERDATIMPASEVRAAADGLIEKGYLAVGDREVSIVPAWVHDHTVQHSIETANNLIHFPDYWGAIVGSFYALRESKPGDTLRLLYHDGTPLCDGTVILRPDGSNHLLWEPLVDIERKD